MSFEIAKQFIDLLLADDNNTAQYLDSKNTTAAIIEFIGGEPFLQIELIDKISNYFIKTCIEQNHPWQYNFIFDICSNGTLYFNPEVQKYLKKYANHVSLSISIDGNQQLHDSCRVYANGEGSYEQAISAVIDYRKHFQRNIGSKMTLSPDNINFTYEAITNLIELNYQSIFVNCIFEKGWNINHAKILYQELKKLIYYILINNINIYISIFEENYFHPKLISDIENWCGGNGKMIALDYKGDIFPCLRFMESSLGETVPPIIIGNVFTGIGTTSQQQFFMKELQSINRLNQSSTECINCSIAEGCSWCQAYNYENSNGNLKSRATYICIMHKAISLANAYFWNLYYIKDLKYGYQMKKH